MLSYKAEQYAYLYLMEYVATLLEERDVRKCIPEILTVIPTELAEYYYYASGNHFCPSIILEYKDICLQGSKAVLKAAQRLGLI